MTLISKLSNSIKTNASVTLVIQQASISNNDIGEKIKTWSTKYSFESIFYAKRNIGLTEKGEKIKIQGYYKARFDISNIADDVDNVTIENRVKIGDDFYKIEFIDFTFSDHVVLDLTLIK